jgi:hypothetical protein
MTRAKLIKSGVAMIAAASFVVQAPTKAHARYDDHDAKRACENAVERNYGYREIRNTQVADKGHHDYRVTGEIVLHGAKDKRYVCNIRHREVVNVKVLDGEHHNGSRDHDSNVATAVGVGVLGLALVAAIASGGDDSGGAEHSWQDNGGSPFDDYDQLKAACAHELERHLNADHGRVRRVSIRNAHLENRNLKGAAHVKWRGGEEADLSFDCRFDRQGRIHDGTYHYTTSRSPESSPTGPYTTRDYDATTILSCSMGSPSHDQSCPAGIHRGQYGSASISIQSPRGRERILNFNDGDVTTPNGGNLTWGKEGGTWYIGIDDREFYVVPEGAVFGG